MFANRLHLKAHRDMHGQQPHAWATIAKFTGLTVLLSVLPLAAQHTASKGHAAAQTAAAQKSTVAAPRDQALAAGPMLARTEISKSTAASDTVLGDFRITQLTRPTPVKAGQCIARIELLFGMAGSVVDLRVTHITKEGIGIVNTLGTIRGEEGIKPVVSVGYGKTKVLGVGVSNSLEVHAQKGPDGTPLLTAVFIPSYTTETYIVSPGALIMGPPALRVVYVGSGGVGLSPVFSEDTIRLAYGEIVRTMADSLPVSIGVRKFDNPGQAKLHITHVDGIKDAVTSSPKKQPAKSRPRATPSVKRHAKQRK